MADNADYERVLGLIGAHLTDVRRDPEFTLRTSKGTGLRYAETVLAELFEQACDRFATDRHPDAYDHGEPWGPDNPAPRSGR
jgi:hypothetical protein